MSQTVRIEVPTSLCALAAMNGEIEIVITGRVTQRTILDELEARYPALLGTLRDHTTKLRRPYIRFFACQQDLSNLSPDELLPDPVAQGLEPFMIVGAIAGG